MDVRRLARLLALVALLATAACGGGGGAAPTPVPTASPTPGAVQPSALTLDGETYVAVRTLPPSSLSADKLEAAGTATADGTQIPVARADTPDAAPWELVSAAPDGWRVWQPRAVVDTLDAAGGGATLVSVKPMDWPDSCLGLARPGEACAQIVTPGYLVVVERAGKQTTYHVGRAGSMRIAP